MDFKQYLNWIEGMTPLIIDFYWRFGPLKYLEIQEKMNKIYKISRGLYSSIKLNCFPHEYIWDEYPSTILILPYTWNNDVFRDKKGFWCIKITNQIISLLKGYTNLVKEHSFLHLRLHVRPFMNILPHQIRICEYLSNWNPLLIWKNIAPWCIVTKIAQITKPPENDGYNL